MPAPADMRPKAKEAAPIRDKLGSKTSGIRKPSKLKANPLVVAKTEGVANQFAQHARFTLPCHGPNGPHIEHGHAKADEHGNQQ